jgi:putative holliday junction resolvase
MARLLGIDYGAKRIGLALSDEDGRIAFPKTVIPNDVQLVSAVSALIREYGVLEVVIGESKDNRGGDNPIAEKARAFGADLARSSGVTIYFEPEFYSSQEVRVHTGSRHDVDAGAAAVILNSFLTKRHEHHH